jgi:hypothetical protein
MAKSVFITAIIGQSDFKREVRPVTALAFHDLAGNG